MVLFKVVTILYHLMHIVNNGFPLGGEKLEISCSVEKMTKNIEL